MLLYEASRCGSRGLGWGQSVAVMLRCGKQRKQCRSNDVFDGMAKMGGKGHEECSSWGVPVAANGDGVAPIPAMI